MYVNDLKGWLTPAQFEELKRSLPSPALGDLDKATEIAVAYRLGIAATLEAVRKYVKEV